MKNEQIQMVNGVIMISWRQKVLERQIDYGAKLGQVVLSLAKMELNNFYKNVIPVADYYDQSNMLISVRIAIFILLGGIAVAKWYQITVDECLSDPVTSFIVIMRVFSEHANKSRSLFPLYNKKEKRKSLVN